MVPDETPLSAYIALLAEPAMNQDSRKAFFAVIAITSSADEAAALRRLVEFFLSDGPEPPVDLDPPPQPRSPWDD